MRWPALPAALAFAGMTLPVTATAAEKTRPKPEFDCEKIAQSPGVRTDPLRLQAKVENIDEKEVPRLALTSTPVLYWPKKIENPPRSCVALVLRPRTEEPLLLENSVLSPDEKGLVHVYVERKEDRTVLLITQVDEQGELHPTRIRIEDHAVPPVPAAERPIVLVQKAPGDDRKFRSSVQLGLQWGVLDYSQSQLNEPYGSVVQTLKAGYSLSLDSRGTWLLDAGGYATLFHYSQSEDDSPRYFGANLRASYPLPIKIESSLQPEFRIGAGWYFLTMDVPSSAFGFQNLSGPQIFPMVSLKLPDGSRVSAYLKVSAVNEGFAIRSLGNVELAAGAQWSPAYSWSKGLSVTLDLSTLSSQIEEQQVHVDSLQLGIGYRFF